MALTAQGVAVYWSSTTANSTDSTNLVGELTDISGPTGAKAEIDVTNMQSAGKEYIMALPDYGDLSFTLFYNGTNVAQNALFTNFQDASSPKKNCTIKLTDSTTAPKKIMFDAYVKSFQWSMAKEDVIKASVSLRISGAATLSS